MAAVCFLLFPNEVDEELIIAIQGCAKLPHSNFISAIALVLTVAPWMRILDSRKSESNGRIVD